MKLMIRFPASCGLLCGLLWFTPVIQAAGPADRPERVEQAATRLKQLAGELALTDEQRTAIAALMEKHRARLDAIRDDGALRPRKKIKQVRELRETFRDEIRAQLTPEQQKKFDAMPRERPRKD
jgi:Spy/CpxP family protein refolding chaperone